MQHDYVISNDTGANVRADINNVLQAILTNNAGATQPSATQAGMFWGDISNASTYYLKIRNHTNDGWVSLYAYDVATKTISPANTPAGNISSTTVQGAINELDTEKQATLVSGTNIKSINSSSILASGNLDLVAKVSSTDNAIVRFDGTSGAVQNSSVVIDDSGKVGIGTSPDVNFKTTIDCGATLSPLYLKTSGTNAYMYLKDGGTTDYQVAIGSNSGALRLVTAGTERMRIDSSGNVGIGVTPSAWSSTFKAIDLVSKGALISRTDTTGITGLITNSYFNGSNYVYKSNGGASFATAGESRFDFLTAPSGTAGNAITWTTAMTLDASGNLVVGGGNIQNFVQANGNIPNTSVYIQAVSTVGTSSVYQHTISNVIKSAILANGNFQSATNSYGSTSDIKLKENIVDTTSKLDKLMQVQVRNFNYIGEEQKQIGVVAQEIEEIFPSIVYETKDTKQVEVEKERIIPAVEEVTEQKLVTEAVFDEEGNVITEAVYETVVVQEAKPESIEKYTETETVETGEVTKNVKYSVIYMMMLKGMQEQQQIIDDLTARIKALEVK